MTAHRIIHIITDYPDGISTENSYAIDNLLKQTDAQAEHFIVSLNRVRQPVFRIEQRRPDLMVCEVFSPPWGVLSNSFLWLAAILLRPYLLKSAFKADLIHGHKLTTDGVLAYFLSKSMNLPLALTIQGETDERFVRCKPLSRWLFGRVMQHALHTFWLSAWAQPVITQCLNAQPASGSHIPIICQVPELSTYPAPEAEEPAHRFVFMGRLACADRKGLWHILDVLADRPDYQLDIYGPVIANELEALEQYIDKLDIKSQVRYCGLLSPGKFTEVLPRYIGLLMPARNETFGMVYVEALMCGLPVLCCAGSGIDGFIQKPYIRLAAYADVEVLGGEMDILFNQSDALKQQIRKDWQAGELDLFIPDRIGKQYTDWLDATLSN